MAQAAAVAKQPAPPRRRRGSATPRTLPYLPYLLIAPAGLLMLGFIAYPVLSVFYYSLRNFNPTKPWRNGYAGFDNFVQIFTKDTQFWDTLTFSAKWVVVEVGLQLLFGLALALIVNQTFVGRALGRALVFSPWAVSGVLTSAIWVLLYNSQTGITRYLADMGVGEYGTSWLSDTSTVFPAAVIADLWRGVPFFAILILADLQSVSKDLYEAAEVDGAGRLRQFFHITLPHLKDAIVLSTLLRAVWEFNNVDLLYTLTGGGPAGETTTLPLYIANTSVDAHNFGYASALTTVAFTILLFFSIVYLRLSKFGGGDK
ncbi:transporter [Streptomyces avermitilis]|uniref:Multiple sugar ABC transporter permease protein n=2 Tax=Streptomyces avermitilis TaxID=33903 RepID=Q829P1_STRAW|nr:MULTISPECIES: sugar ABC transporter permease [Streptomyces]KUN54111.1 transporter [Streptomyces avermitilis]MYT01916.1 ABC transporter permease subunit [Streptomyces sp. SID5469]OOV11500.1 transporter [Streptomyces avermitilis]BAC74079.1 putative multiple sugar ABC transporter permease protein [Streptomyces avermitilis MA-4680 = NBRC 14893]BBJ54606.1 transporter [Streptomyces avermitilis]